MSRLRLLPVFTLIVFHSHTGIGQIVYRIGPEHADCRNAIELFDTVYGPTTAPSGWGGILEFNSHRTDLYSFETEHNTVWYLFETDRYCDLLLDIIPVSVSDDYDFILFMYEGSETCVKIAERKIRPVRSCISRNDTTINSHTGLSYEAKDDFIHSGPGPSYSRALPVKPGERYLLVLDNVYPNGSGHYIHLKYRNCNEPPPPVAEERSNFLSLYVRDASTFQIINAEITLVKRAVGRSTDQTETWDDTGSIIVKLDPQSTYQIVVKAPGYFQFTDQVKTGSDFQTYLKTANMIRIEEGKKVSFNNILFFGGSDQFLRESYPILDDIIQTLKDQAEIEVEIIGHVNEPHNFRSGNTVVQNQALSERRAQAVYNYLIRKGIDASRLSWSGKGNSEMIYPYANTEEQMQANRRVELLIKKTGQ